MVRYSLSGREICSPSKEPVTAWDAIGLGFGAPSRTCTEINAAVENINSRSSAFQLIANASGLEPSGT